MRTRRLRKSIGRSPLRRGFLLILRALCCFALCSTLQAITPAPDGGYPGGNTAAGQNTLQSLTSGAWNTALGYQALYSNTTGNFNSAEGMRALFSDTTGHHNTASGVQALYSNTAGNFNTANGVNTLYSNSSGSQNTAAGYQTLGLNTTGGDNTATGFKALASNTASQNTANGSQALYNNTTGGPNTAIGYQALFSNTTGSNNTASGYQALYSNTTGGQNAANGILALYSNTDGADNTADGEEALYSNTTGINNTAIGAGALGSNTTGVNNIALGDFAGAFLTMGSNNIDIGNAGVAADSKTIRIGTQGTQEVTFIAGIYGVTASGGAAVYINSSGELGTATSSARFKQDIRGMDTASETILALRPVTFRYKPALDPKGLPQFGLVAEEVEKVNPALVVRDADGKPYSVRYEAVNAMLLNEFLKEHRKVEQLEKQVETLTAGLQKVSAQLELRKPAPQMVVKNQ